MSSVSHPSGGIGGGIRGWIGDAARSWNEFWFAPRAPHTLAMIRILCGAMLVYVHLIWLTQANDFFGPHAWIDGATVRLLHELDYSRSYLSYISNVWIIGAHELIAMAVCAAMMLGFKTRLAIPIAWFMTLMVCHRQTGALFGLDQMVMMLSMYLIFCPCGAVYSLDAWLERRRSGVDAEPDASVAINVVTRLIQVHLCIIYLFGGLSKLRGDFWWEGSAMWWSIVNYEYQSLDVTWLGRSPFLIALVTHATVFWETFYAALVWPRLTRPLVLAMAVLVHGGIALFLGMPTFGTIMIVANLAFIEPETMGRWVEWGRGKVGLS
ncbi:MAG: HTTM domain-containing protein [Aureliella sp.]